MKILIVCLIIIGSLYKNQVSGLPAEARVQDASQQGLQAISGLPAEARVQGAVAQLGQQAISLPSGLALSSEERQTGQSIASQLESVMLDTSSSSAASGRHIIDGTYPDFPHIRPEPRYHDLDCVLVLDSSGSIGRSKFEEAKRATKVVVDYIHYRAPISSHGSRIGLIEYSSSAQTHVEFSFPDYSSVWGVKRAIDRVDYDYGGSTATDEALRMAKTEIDRYGRWGNAKLVWLMSDGRANTGSPLPAARALKNNDVTVCAIGVGNSVDMTEIRAIASPGCAFRVSSFESYERVMKFADAQRGDSGPQSGSPSVDPGFFNDIQL